MDAPSLPIRDAMSLREMVAIAFRHRRKMLGALAVPPALALAAVLLLPPKYRAQSDLLVKTGREYLAQADGDAGLTAPTSTKQEGINSEISLLTSRAVVEATIAAVGIDVLYPGLAEDPPWFASPLDTAVEKFSRDLSAEPVKLSNIIAVSFDAGTPEKAKLVLNRLVGIYIDKHTQVFSGGRSDSYGEALARGEAETLRLERQRTRIKLDAGIYDIGTQRAALISQRVAAEAHLQDTVNAQAMLHRPAGLPEAAAAQHGGHHPVHRDRPQRGGGPCPADRGGPAHGGGGDDGALCPGQPGPATCPQPDRGAGPSGGRWRPRQRDHPALPVDAADALRDRAGGGAAGPPGGGTGSLRGPGDEPGSANCTGSNRPTWSCAPPRRGSTR